MADRSDVDLSRQAAAGDETAFELLVHRHVESVWRLARSLVADDYEAEEAVQETFIKAYRSLHSFRREASFRTWLLAICHRSCIDRWRRRGPEVVSLIAVQEHRAGDQAIELRLVIEDALRLLRPDERNAFLLVHVLGYSREEAAQICGVPASTLRSRVERARERLADIITETPAQEQHR